MIDVGGRVKAEFAGQVLAKPLCAGEWEWSGGQYGDAVM
jgi:hypothetical protein